jgi:hypothetical protein
VLDIDPEEGEAREDTATRDCTWGRGKMMALKASTGADRSPPLSWKVMLRTELDSDHGDGGLRASTGWLDCKQFLKGDR